MTSGIHRSKSFRAVADTDPAYCQRVVNRSQTKTEERLAAWCVRTLSYKRISDYFVSRLRHRPLKPVALRSASTHDLALSARLIDADPIDSDDEPIVRSVPRDTLGDTLYHNHSFKWWWTHYRPICHDIMSSTAWTGGEATHSPYVTQMFRRWINNKMAQLK
jgi:hypothetical protein